VPAMAESMPANAVDFAFRVRHLRRMAEARVRIAVDESALVAAAAAGDRDAFGRLYERYASMVHGVLLARVQRADAEDLMQEVFLSAMRRLGDLRDHASFGGWLLSIARNRANDHHRKRRETDELDMDVVVDHNSTDAHEAVRVLALLRALPEAYREPLALRLVEGLTGPEIAERTGMSHGSVRVNLHRGLQLLREKLGVNHERA